MSHKLKTYKMTVSEKLSNKSDLDLLQIVFDIQDRPDSDIIESTLEELYGYKGISIPISLQVELLQEVIKRFVSYSPHISKFDKSRLISKIK